MPIIVKTAPVGPLEANCYLIGCDETGEAMIVDPGDEPDTILEMAEGFNVKFIVLTHAHFDHAGAIPDLKQATQAPVLLHTLDAEHYSRILDQAAFWGYKLAPLPAPDVLVNEGDEIEVGNLTFAVIHTPGHSPGSMCLYGEGTLITGDTLFAGSIGRTDFPGGSMARMRESFVKLMGLPDDTRVLSGHGPATTIGRERRHNMFAMEFLGR